MEYNSKFDFYLKFKPIYNKEGYFIDYIMTYASDSFSNAVGISPSMVLGKRFSEIVVDMDVFGFKEFYSTIIPNSKIKYELLSLIHIFGQVYCGRCKEFYRNKQKQI